MKNFLFLLGFIMFSVSAKAQYTKTLNSKVSISSDADLEFLLDAHIDKNTYTDTDMGYRIQIINSTNRDEAYAKKAELYQYNSSVKAYLVYDQPYYKLRVGDFLTRLEAYAYLNKIIKNFSSAFVVRDEINIKTK